MRWRRTYDLLTQSGHVGVSCGPVVGADIGDFLLESYDVVSHRLHDVVGIFEVDA